MVSCQVTFRRTSHLSMRITKKGEVHVSAPYGCPMREVEHFIGSHRDWIENALARQRTANEQSADFFARLPLESKEDVADARRRIRLTTVPMIEKHAAEMRVNPARIDYRPTTSRWGSCNAKSGRIMYSLYLLLLPDWCVEHVVVHELAHLLVPNHGIEFQAVMDKHFPRWREARLETRRLQRMRIETK